jgi:hypothetical protein
MKHSRILAEQIAGEVCGEGREARQLAGNSDGFSGNVVPTAAPLSPGPFVDTPTEAQVRRFICARRARDSYFEPQLFADPVWDMLLELFATEVGGKRISISSLCIAAAVPATTALRWFSHLEKNGYVVRKEDPLDRRRFHVSLSASAREAMKALFECRAFRPFV